MKVLFLDVDGVLNHRRSLAYLAISKPALRRLRRILDLTQAQVVMSSTWRKLPQTREAFYFKTRIKVLDYTPSFNSGFRGKEIEAWLKAHSEVTRYAILDDDSDMLPEQKPYFVQTSFETGLLDEHVDRVVEILNS